MKGKGRTGDKVQISGEYRNNYGKRISLIAGDNFPPCPKEGKAIDWEKTE